MTRSTEVNLDASSAREVRDHSNLSEKSEDLENHELDNPSG